NLKTCYQEIQHPNNHHHICGVIHEQTGRFQYLSTWREISRLATKGYSIQTFIIFVVRFTSKQIGSNTFRRGEKSQDLRPRDTASKQSSSYLWCDPRANR